MDRLRYENNKIEEYLLRATKFRDEVCKLQSENAHEEAYAVLGLDMFAIAGAAN